MLVVTQKVTAAQHVLEKPEEDLDCPAIGKDQGDHCRWHIQQVGGDAKNTVAVHSARTAAIFSSRRMRIHTQADHTHLVVRLTTGTAVGKCHDSFTVSVATVTLGRDLWQDTAVQPICRWTPFPFSTFSRTIVAPGTIIFPETT